MGNLERRKLRRWPEICEYPAQLTLFHPPSRPDVWLCNGWRYYERYAIDALTMGGSAGIWKTGTGGEARQLAANK